MDNKNIKDLIKKGYFKFNLIPNKFKKINSIIKNIIIKNTNIKNKLNLELIHNQIKISELNNIRLSIFKAINKNIEFKKTLFESASNHIENCVGSEISSSDINLSIQFPKDDSSLLEMHTDFFSGESLFQVNLWVPLVEVKKTQSMFIIDPINSEKILKKIKYDKKTNFEIIKKKYKKKFKWIKLKPGEAILFSPNCLHGNMTNKEKKTRWSFNVRYKNLFSPEGKLNNEKTIGNFYKPISVKGITLFNLKYNFDEISS